MQLSLTNLKTPPRLWRGSPRWAARLPLSPVVEATASLQGYAGEILSRVKNPLRQLADPPYQGDTSHTWPIWILLCFVIGLWVFHSNTVEAAGTVNVPVVALGGGFEVDKKYYPSATSPNTWPDGTLITSPKDNNVYYLRAGKKSWIIPSVLNKWLNENHYFKHDIIVIVPDKELAAWPQVKSVNPLYVGKVLVHPNGIEYFIDDKLRKRELTSTVRAALKIPAGNRYATSAIHLQEFPLGPKLKSDRYPGGMVVYTGAWHGGRIWKILEEKDGSLRKHLYLSDYIYEADYNPDESHRALAQDSLFAKHARGSNIERYPDGWVVGLSSSVYLVQSGKLRHINSPQLMTTLGYKSKYVLTQYPEFLRRYPRGEPIRAFKNILPVGVAATTGAPQAAPDASSILFKVRPTIRTLINQVNNLYLLAYDKDVTASENQFWVNMLYNGEINNQADLLAAMRTTAATGKKPSLTSRTAVLDPEKLKNHWFPYLFYFVHQQEPSDADRDYWFNRIKPGDRDTIEKLGGTLQWVKENLGTTRR